MRRIELRSRLIVFEGLDFTGKTTQVRLLAERLQRANLQVTTTREPGGTHLGEKVRKEILSTENTELLPLSELLLFITCRAQLSAEVIEPSLAAGDVVLCSRFRLSSLAYQGYGRRIDLDLIERLNEAAAVGRQPDLTFLIDLDPKTALMRKRGDGDRIEQEDLAFYRRVREGYIELTRDDPHVHRINGALSVEEIAEKVVRVLDG
ncbi:dTMP kinase [Candidatus Bipolaricaulota bacterium]|nr:dTMP kinase [Candidatus Bipolaricaulota bacterium]